MRLLGNREDAAEVTQEAILRTFWKITGFRGKAHFYTWLYRIALNLCYRRFAARRREPQPSRPSPDASPDAGEGEGWPEDLAVDPSASPRDEAASHETAAVVREALASLSRRDFQILVLREFEQLSYEEVAQRLRIPKGTVMSRLHRARLALARQLERLGVTDAVDVPSAP